MEAVLLYGCESWSLTKSLEKQLDGCYTRLLRATLNINWKEHVSNAVLYSGLQRISDLMKQRRLRFASHCFRRDDKLVADLVLWEPWHGSVSRGRPATTYIDKLVSDSGLDVEDLGGAMRDRSLWAGIVAATISRHDMPP